MIKRCLAALFGMTVGPAVVAWEWFSPGLPAAIAAVLALVAATLPMMVGVYAMNRGGVWASRLVWQIWTFGWAAFGGALFLSLVLE